MTWRAKATYVVFSSALGLATAAWMLGSHPRRDATEVIAAPRSSSCSTEWFAVKTTTLPDEQRSVEVATSSVTVGLDAGEWMVGCTRTVLVRLCHGEACVVYGSDAMLRPGETLKVVPRAGGATIAIMTLTGTATCVLQRWPRP